jgi:hypothetical protein
MAVSPNVAVVAVASLAKSWSNWWRMYPTDRGHDPPTSTRQRPPRPKPERALFE